MLFLNDAHGKSELWELEECKKDKEDDLNRRQKKKKKKTWVGLVELNLN